jgi:hypothetical protein
MVGLAQSYGLDAFQLTKSTKFGAVYPAYGIEDALQPSQKFISQSHRFERDVVVLSSRGLNQKINATNVQLLQSVPEINGVKPLCAIGNKGLYIDAQGQLFPCCWVANRYAHNSEWRNIAAQFNLHTRTLADAIADDFWTTKFKEFGWQECQTKCAIARVTEKYASEW